MINALLKNSIHIFVVIYTYIYIKRKQWTLMSVWGRAGGAKVIESGQEIHFV